jgi:hypothetical protein
MRSHTHKSAHSAMRLMTRLWLCLPILVIAIGLSSCTSRSDRAQSQSDDAESDQGNADKTEDTNDTAQGMEPRYDTLVEKHGSKDAQRFAEDPRSISFGNSKEFEFTTPQPSDPLSNQKRTFVGGEFRANDCLDSAGIKPSIESVSEGESSARITYSVSVDALGENGYEGLLKSLKGCKSSLVMVLVSNNEQNDQKGFTPMALKLSFSEYGVRVEEPRPTR